MSTRKRIHVWGIVLVFVLLFAAIPVWAEDPMPTDKYDLLLRSTLSSAVAPVPTDKYDLLLGLSDSGAREGNRVRGTRAVGSDLGESPSFLPATGLDLSQQADVARWNGWADYYLGSGPSSLPVTGLGRGQRADAARWNGWAEFHAGDR